MSPEQAQALPLSAASDTYALAVILYEALTGKLPFDARSPNDYLKMHATAPPIPLDERVAGLKFPPALVALIDKALAKRPEDRFRSASDLGDALLAIADDITNAQHSVPPASGRKTVEEKPEPPAPPPPPSQPKSAIAALVARLTPPTPARALDVAQALAAAPPPPSSRTLPQAAPHPSARFPTEPTAPKAMPAAPILLAEMPSLAAPTTGSTGRSAALFVAGVLVGVGAAYFLLH
jgi:serine/threonine-protein kinase